MSFSIVCKVRAHLSNANNEAVVIRAYLVSKGCLRECVNCHIKNLTFVRIFED